MSRVYRYTVPIPLAHGAGAIGKLGETLLEFGCSRPLVVTDRGLRDAGLVDRALEGLGEMAASAVVFDGVASNPREEDVVAGRDVYMESGADGIVALGGGSALDAAKGVRLLASHRGSLSDYDLNTGGAARISGEMPVLVAVPTTAGTGSEVSRGALIVTRAGGSPRKTVVASPRMVPSAAVLDPELTLRLPPPLTAGTGLDALSHCLEEAVSPRYHPVVEALAFAAARTIARALPQVWREPSDVEARGEMQMAAMMAGVGFEKGLGVIHSLSHAIGALHDLHHGILNAVMLPASVEFNREHVKGGVLQEFAAAVGLPASDERRAADELSGWLRALGAELDIPPRLRDMKEMAADRDRIIDAALDDHCHRTNPRRCGREEFLEFWEMTY